MTSIKNFLSFNPDEKGFVLLADEAEAVQVKEMAECMLIDADMDKKYWMKQYTQPTICKISYLQNTQEPGIEEIIFEEKGPEDESEDKNKESKDIQESEPRRSNKGASPDMYMGVLNMAVSLGEPKDRKDALSRPDAELWIKAMDEEMDSLKNNKTWDLVIPPKKRKVIGCIWVYKIRKKHRRRN